MSDIKKYSFEVNHFQGFIPSGNAICGECIKEIGDKIVLLDSQGMPIDSVHPVSTARELLLEGKVIAIKGVGGYHLACNACDDKAVALLRKRKRRPDRPLAVMAAGLDAAKSICKTTYKEEETLTGRKRPIVLLEKRFPEMLAYGIAPGVNRLGVMLPYTPLHILLFGEGLQYLVMTSGNISRMPICYKDQDAFEKLKGIADFFLVHDREILTPIDDSVVRVVDEEEMVSRNGRDYFPLALRMDWDSEILAVGGEQKASICLLHKGYGHISQYLGSLEDMKAYEEYLKAVKSMKALLGAEPQIIAHDLHTGYLSTRYAIKQPAVRLPVQHHHAHMAACMAEHGLKKDAIGVIYDGTGLGTDGAIWGGEFLVGSISKFSRVGHWKYVTLQGGDSAIKEPWKSAASYLYAMGINSGELVDNVDNLKIKAVENAIKHNINCFKSSSMGRLFDCVSALVLKRIRITYDAQAAIELESAIDLDVKDYYPYSINESEGKLEIDYEEILSGILSDMKSGKTPSYISAKFHNSICQSTIDCVCRIRGKYGINDVALGGGVFENTYILKTIKRGLKDQGFNIYCSMQIPANDGGIAFGQASAAAQMIKEGNYVPGSSGKDCIRR